MVPQRSPSRNVANNDFSGKLAGGGVVDWAKRKNAAKHKMAVNMIFNFFNMAS